MKSFMNSIKDPLNKFLAIFCLILLFYVLGMYKEGLTNPNSDNTTKLDTTNIDGNKIVNIIFVSDNGNSAQIKYKDNKYVLITTNQSGTKNEYSYSPTITTTNDKLPDIVSNASFVGKDGGTAKLFKFNDGYYMIELSVPNMPNGNKTVFISKMTDNDDNQNQLYTNQSFMNFLPSSFGFPPPPFGGLPPPFGGLPSPFGSLPPPFGGLPPPFGGPPPSFEFPPPSTQQYDYSPPSNQQYNYSPPSTQQYDYSPPSTQQYDYSPPSTQQYDYSPPLQNQSYNNSNSYNQSYDYSNDLPPGIPSSKIPPGEEDLYILKSEIVPPVCPACPSPVPCIKSKTDSCAPCPPCGRCPEPSFECKKVPNYSSTNYDIPDAILAPYSTFGS